MRIRVDPQSAEPLFEQIAFQVKNAVAKGQTPAGHKLPSVRELARELAINPNTVVRAYDTLETDGVIVRRKGAGCFTTGKSSELAAPRKRKELRALLERAATEAFHLGFRDDEIREALEAALASLEFHDSRNKDQSR